MKIIHFGDAHLGYKLRTDTRKEWLEEKGNLAGALHPEAVLAPAETTP